MKVTIDGQSIEVAPGTTILQAARMIGGESVPPAMCYYSKLEKTGGKCRCCLVEVSKGSDADPRPMPKLMASCVTGCMDGMEVNSKNSDRVREARQSVTEFLLINHPLDCPICDQAGECDLQDLSFEHGKSKTRFIEEKRTFELEDIGPNIQLHMNRCILCQRCVAVADQLTDNRVHGVLDRGDHANISTCISKAIDNEFSGNMIDVCPVGALTSKDFRFKQRVWFLESFDAICNGCSKGCNIYVDHRKEKYKDDKIFRFRPRVNKSINGWFLCDEGRLSYTKEETNRFFTPILNKSEVSLNDALASMFKELTTHNNILFVLSPNLSYEEISNLKNLASKLNANVSGYSPDTFDSSFGDDYLRNSDKAVNRASFKELEINETKEYFEYSLNSSSLIIIFENSYFENNLNLLKDKKVVSFFSHNCLTIGNSDISIPVTSFYEKNGTYINCDNIKQKVISKMNKNNPMSTITSIIENLKSMIEKGAL